jgi:hypothetical protein
MNAIAWFSIRARPNCLRADDGPRQLECLESARRAGVRALAGPRQPGFQLLHASKHVLERDRALFEQHLGRVRGSDPHLPFLLALPDALGPGRDDEAGLPAGAELWLDRGDHHVDARDAAVGDEDLLAVEDPVAVLPHGASLHRRDIRTGVGLGDGERADRRLLNGAETGWDPGRDLLGRALREDGGDRQSRALDGEGDPGATPGQLLGDQRRHDAGGVGVHLLEEVDPVKANLGGLLDHRPRELLRLVVLHRDGPDLLLREGVDPFPDLPLLVTQLERNHLALGS